MNIVYSDGRRVTRHGSRPPSVSVVSKDFGESIRDAIAEDFTSSLTGDSRSKSDSNWAAVAHIYVGSEGGKKNN